MSGVTDILIKKLADTINSSPAKKVSPYDTQAEVRRIDGDIAWVHIPGGVDETPVQLTTNAKKGDIVQVRVSGGRAWLYGNQTSPPTDDKKAIEADNKAIEADNKAEKVKVIAIDAKDLADSANEYAGIAKEAADNAQESAGDAQSYATNAYNSATQALNQLSVVEDVVGVLDLISKNGDYQLTQDAAVQENKWYFVRSGSGTEADPYVYEVVVPADDADPSSLGYYELVGIDQAIQNYVSSHLTLSGNSLFLQNGDTRVELSTTEGMILYNENGDPVAKYGTDTIIGNINNFGIKIGESPESTQQTPVYELGFYQNGNRVAYINNNSLYITQTVVLKQMQMGDTLGVWAWCIHEVSNKNNLYLKWLG